jgi:hypothetical protein
MKMAKPLLAAVPLALVLLAAVLVVVAVTPGAFGFHAWPKAPAPTAHERVVAVAEPAFTPPRAAHPAGPPAQPVAPRIASAPSHPLPQARPVRTPDAVGGSKQQPSGDKAPVPAPATPAAPADVSVVEARQPAPALPAPLDGTN